MNDAPDQRRSLRLSHGVAEYLPRETAGIYWNDLAIGFALNSLQTPVTAVQISVARVLTVTGAVTVLERTHNDAETKAEIIAETTTETIADTAAETSTWRTTETTVETAAETNTETTTETAAGTIAETIADTIADTIAETTTETTAEDNR